jgi:hypothetical protein
VRKTRSSRYAVLAFLLTAGAGCPGRHAPAPAAETGRAERQTVAPPILALMGQRDLLSLTPDQVVALDSAHQRWSAENDRLTHRGTVVSAGVLGATVENRAVAPTGPEAQANHGRAARAVQEILDSEQERAVCELYRRRRERAHRLWPWCSR